MGQLTTTVLQPTLSAAEAWREIAERRIGLTCALDARLWLASVERVKSPKPFTRDQLEFVSATGSTPLAAVRALLAKLDGDSMECPF